MLCSYVHYSLKNLLSTYCVAYTILGAWNLIVNRNKVPTNIVKKRDYKNTIK